MKKKKIVFPTDLSMYYPHRESSIDCLIPRWVMKDGVRVHINIVSLKNETVEFNFEVSDLSGAEKDHYFHLEGSAERLTLMGFIPFGSQIVHTWVDDNFVLCRSQEELLEFAINNSNEQLWFLEQSEHLNDAKPSVYLRLYSDGKRSCILAEVKVKKKKLRKILDPEKLPDLVDSLTWSGN